MPRESMCISWIEQLNEIEETFADFFEYAYGLYEDLEVAEKPSDESSEV